jgi:hypothetical protein
MSAILQIGSHFRKQYFQTCRQLCPTFYSSQSHLFSWTLRRYVFQISGSHCCDGDTNLPGTSESSLVFCQTCFTSTPNTTGTYTYNIKITARSHYVYTSSAIPTALSHFTPRRPFYGDYMSSGNITTYLGTYAKALLFLPNCHQIWNFSTDFHKVPISTFTSIRPVDAALLHVDTRTDTHDDGKRCFLANIRTRLNMKNNSHQ